MESDEDTCGASLMPDGHRLADKVYCNESLSCAAPVETTLYNCSASVLKSTLVQFDKGLCSLCGLVQLTKTQRKEQGCKGDVQGKWSQNYPRCDSCAAQGLTAASVHKTKAASQASVRAGKRKAATSTARRSGASTLAKAAASSDEESTSISSSDENRSEQCASDCSFGGSPPATERAAQGGVGRKSARHAVWRDRRLCRLPHSFTRTTGAWN